MAIFDRLMNIGVSITIALNIAGLIMIFTVAIPALLDNYKRRSK